MKLTGGQIIAEYLIKEGVPYIIGIPGHGSIGLADAFLDKQDKIKMMMTKTENAAVYMADGYYRVTGQPLAIYTSIGPGAINTAIGLATTFVESTAVLAFTGDTHTHMMGKGVLQEIERRQDSNFARIIEPVTKRYWRATQPNQLPSIMHRAFSEMLCGRPGPCLVSLPMNVQCDSAEVTLPEPVHHRPAGTVHPDLDKIAKAAKVLMEGKRPVILAGGGINSAQAWEELKAVAEALGAAVVTTFQGKGCFPEDHPLSGLLTGAKGTTCGIELCTKADVMLAVGCRFADETAGSYRQGSCLNIPPTKLVQIDIDDQEIGKNYPVEVGVVGDAKVSLAALADVIKVNYPARDYKTSEYTLEIARLRKQWADHLAKWEDTSKDPMMITSLLREVRSALKRDAIVVSSSGNTQAQILQEFPFYEPRTNLTSAGFSTMGWALPAALGAKLAKPETQVCAIMGDGDFMMTMYELATAVQYDLPIVVVLANNCGWQCIKDLQMDVFGDDRAINVEFKDKNGQYYTPNFAEIAKNFGAHGERITRADQVKGAMERALASGKPALIEAMCQTEHPYTGSPAMGWWDVPVPTYLTERRAKYEKERTTELL